MSNAENGFRYGTKESTWPKNGEWIFVKGSHKAYDVLRRDQHALDSYDGALLALEQKIQKALDFVRYSRCLLLGGHVRKDKYGQVSALAQGTSEPAAVLNLAKSALAE